MNVNFERFKTATKLERVPTFGYNSRMRKIFIELQQGKSLKFRPKLASMLGITTNPIHCGTESRRCYGDELVNVDGTIHTLYVYCNIVEPMLIGDDEAPLLRTVDV